MPQMGISVSEGTILEWRKRPGDWIEADETIADVTTDKVDVEIPSPASGRLASDHRRSRRDRRGRRTVLAEIDAAAKPGEAHPDEDQATGRGRHGVRPRAPADRPGSGDGPPRHPRPTGIVRVLFAGRAPHRRQARRRPRARSRGPASAGACGRGTCSPSSRQRRHGRSCQGGAAPAHRVAVPARAEPERPPSRSPSRERPASGASRCRRCARRSRSTWSRAAAPPRTVTTVVEVDFSRVAATRAELKEAMERRGVGLTYLAFVAGATVEALQEFPVLNASVDGRRRGLPRRRQPRHRGRARRRADRAGDPEGAAAQPRGHGRRDRRRGQRARERSSSIPTRSTAARSRSPTPGSSGR